MLLKSHPLRHPDVLIAVMGSSGAGKTSFINLASGSQLRIGRGLKSCTNEIQTAELFQLDDCNIKLVDTPGFDDTTRSDTDILRLIAQYLQQSYEDQEKLSGVIYVHRITDVRMGGISTRNFNMFRKLCGTDSLKNVVIVTTGWEQVDKEDGELREEELRTDDIFFKSALKAGASMFRHYRNNDSAKSILRHILSKQPTVLKLQEELVDKKMNLAQTDAGSELNKVLIDRIRQTEAEMERLKVDLQENIATKVELEMAYKKLQSEVTLLRTQCEKLKDELVIFRGTDHGHHGKGGVRRAILRVFRR